MCEPVGVAEVAARLGVKPQTVAQWRLRGIMPAPTWTVSGLPCWDWPDIAGWAHDTGRDGSGPVIGTPHRRRGVVVPSPDLWRRPWGSQWAKPDAADTDTL